MAWQARRVEILWPADFAPELLEKLQAFLEREGIDAITRHTPSPPHGASPNAPKDDSGFDTESEYSKE